MQEVPSDADRHLLSRFTWGVTPDLVAQATAAGGAMAWFEAQLDPASIADPEGEQAVTWWPHLRWTAEKKWKADLTGEYPGFVQDQDFARWSLVYHIVTTRQLQDVMADFWSNELYIPVPERKTYNHRFAYDVAVRSKALSTFEELLKTAILHPAMLCYLDNAKSTKQAPNENLGRELLELHTVGRPAGYDEQDVRSSTRALTGYRVEFGGRCLGYYSPADHETGPIKVLDFEHPNNSPDGRAAMDAYLTYLAHHPATAARICRELAVRFVSDEPSEALVADLARVFIDSGTDIKTVLRRLVAHQEFLDSQGMKARTPCEDLVNSFRVLQAKFLPPEEGNEDSGANALVFLASVMGQKPFGWPRPDGFPDHAERWTSASRMLGSWKIHKTTSGGSVPRRGVEYKPTGYWLPPLPAPFRDVADYASRLILARPISSKLLKAAEIAVDYTSDKIVKADSSFVRFRVPLLLQVFLDSPDHMTR